MGRLIISVECTFACGSSGRWMLPAVAMMTAATIHTHALAGRPKVLILLIEEQTKRWWHATD